MVPAGIVDHTIADIVAYLHPGDIVIDGGNSYYIDDIRRSRELAEKGIHYVDVGTSGGVWGLERGYCMMIGGEQKIISHLAPIFSTLAPGIGLTPRTPGRDASDGTAELGYLHCGPNGAGHFVKMVHNGIEYGVMAAYAEGLSVLRAANAGNKPHDVDAETTPLRNPEHYRYDLDLRDITEVWRRGSVIASGLPISRPPRSRRTPNCRSLAGAWRIQAKGDGRSRRQSTKPCRSRCSPRRCISASVREAKRPIRNGCCPRCASSSAGTSKGCNGRPKVRRVRVLRRHG